MTETDDELMDSNERNSALLMCIAMLAFAIENDEPFNVDKQIVSDIIESNIQLGTSVPKVAFQHTDDNRLMIGVTMHTPEEIEKELAEAEDERT